MRLVGSEKGDNNVPLYRSPSGGRKGLTTGTGKAKRSAAQPTIGALHAVTVPAKEGVHTRGRRRSLAAAQQRADAAVVGRFAAGNPAVAGTHLTAHLAVATAVRLALPRAAGALRGAGPAVPRFREPSPRLSRRHVRPRPRNHRIRPQAAVVLLLPVGTTPEDQATPAEAWTATTGRPHATSRTDTHHSPRA